jgi:hypothetical protein
MVSILGSVLSQVPTSQALQEPLPASNLLDLIPAIIIVVLAVFFLFLAIKLSQVRTDGVGSLYLLAGVFLFLACVFQMIFLFLRSEWLYTFIFAQEVFLLLALIAFILTAVSLRRSALKSVPPEEKAQAPSEPLASSEINAASLEESKEKDAKSSEGEVQG